MLGLRWVRVHGHSMEPTLRQGEHLLVSLRSFRRSEPRVGDVVLVQHPTEPFRVVKRIVAGPGGSADGRPLGPHEFYVRGDNSRHTTDSDHYGPVGRALILGRVVCRFPSLRRLPRAPP